jgi:hypothetical protein
MTQSPFKEQLKKRLTSKKKVCIGTAFEAFETKMESKIRGSIVLAETCGFPLQQST